MEFVQIDNACLLLYGYSNSFNPSAFVLTNLSVSNTNNIFVPINFSIVGSRMNVERVSCFFENSYVYCGVIHTSHLLTWLKMGIKSVNQTVTISNYTSTVFQNHPSWRPANLELTSEYMAVEALSTNSSEMPKILLYNMAKSEYTWYSISLMNYSITSYDMLSFILAPINGTTNVIVANRRPDTNYLMYFQFSPMILSISDALTQEEYNSLQLGININLTYSSIVPLSSLIAYRGPPRPSSVDLLTFGIVFGIIILVVLVTVIALRVKREKTRIGQGDVEEYLHL